MRSATRFKIPAMCILLLIQVINFLHCPPVKRLSLYLYFLDFLSATFVVIAASAAATAAAIVATIVISTCS